MARPCRIALVGDFNPGVIAHRAIPEALRLAAMHRGIAAEVVWVHTASIHNPRAQLERFDGIWCVPASPYANMNGALAAIRYAREQRRPFFGSCDGFQHALIEYARNVCGLREAGHAESDPADWAQLIAPLSCPLVEESGEIILSDRGILRDAYGTDRIVEEYRCSYGLNKDYEKLLFGGDLRVTGRDTGGEVRAVELSSHPFFAATLFQSERRALRGEIPRLAAAFLNTIA